MPRGNDSNIFKSEFGKVPLQSLNLKPPFVCAYVSRCPLVISPFAMESMVHLAADALDALL